MSGLLCLLSQSSAAGEVLAGPVKDLSLSSAVVFVVLLLLVDSSQHWLIEPANLTLGWNLHLEPRLLLLWSR